MESRYYIGTKPQANGYHYIHREDCALLPSSGKRLYLGSFHSPGEAAREAGKCIRNADFCRFCLSEHHHEARNHIFAGSGKNQERISSIALIQTWETALICGVN